MIKEVGKFLYKDIIKEAQKYTDKIVVGFSTGKDSIVLLDILSQYFEVTIVFQYIVEGLSFQESVLDYVKKKYKVKVVKIPNWMLSHFLRNGYYRHQTIPSDNVKVLTFRDGVENMKKEAGMDWVALGHKKSDSVTYRRFLTKYGAVQTKLKRVYPLIDFTDKHIYNYIRSRNIPMPTDYSWFNQNMPFTIESVKIMKDNFPEDYKKIKEVFPLIGAGIKKLEWYVDTGVNL